MASETDEYKVIVSADGSQYNSTFEKLNRTLESHLNSERRVKTNLAGLAQSMLGAQNAATALTGVTEHLSEVFKIGLPAVAGIAVAVRIFDAVAESEKKANEEAEKMTKSIDGLGNTNAFTSSVDGFESIAEASKKAREAQQEHFSTARADDPFRQAGFFESLEQAAALIYDKMTGTADAFTRSKLAAAQLTFEARAIAELNAKATQALREEVELTQARASGEAGIAAQLEIEGRWIKAIEQAKKAGAGTTENIALINQRFDLESQIAARAQASTERQLALERRLVDIKKEGGDVEVESAKARYEAAARAEDLAPPGPLRQKAITETNDALNALQAAEHVRDVRRDELNIAAQIAEVTGSADRKRLAALQLQAHQLRRAYDGATSDDERAQINSQLRVNAAQQREVDQRRKETQLDLNVQSAVARIKAQPLSQVGETQRKAADLGGEIAVLQQRLNSPEARSDPQERQKIASSLLEKQDAYSQLRTGVANNLDLGGVSSLQRVGGGGGVARGNGNSQLLSKIDQQTQILQQIAKNTDISTVSSATGMLP